MRKTVVLLICGLLCVCTMASCVPGNIPAPIDVEISSDTPDKSVPDSSTDKYYIDRPIDMGEQNNQPILSPGDPGYEAPPGPMPGD